MSNNDLITTKATSVLVAGVVAVLGMFILAELITEQQTQMDIDLDLNDVDIQDTINVKNMEDFGTGLGNIIIPNGTLSGSWNIDAIIYVIGAGIGLIVIGRAMGFVR